MDYKKIGFKCGIEVHNRLATSHKLFCNCPAEISNEEPILEVQRKLRPVAGELGKIDPAALFEAMRSRKFNYQLFDSNCLVEIDDEPPRKLNQDALDVVLTVSKMLNAHILDEVHVMRKTVTDGSNTSAFQRTALISKDGKLETSQGNVGIDTVCLEEESAGIIGKEKGVVTYRLDRLGIPLIEIATAPQIKDPKHARELAQKIGMLVRSTGKSQRGIGTIRQDVNVSIKGGARVEIKGLQELDLIEKIIDNEIQRQLSLLKIKAKVKGHIPEAKDVSEIFRLSKSFVGGLVKKEKAWAIKIPNANGLGNFELCPGKTLGRELADYAVAHGVKGLIHSDEDLSKYNLQNEFQELRLALQANRNDAVILIAGRHSKRAIDAVRNRAKLLSREIPEETRVANPDGTTTYTRPLPGSGRMYPETDLEPIRITHEMLKKIKIPESWDKKKKRFSKILPKDMIDQILKSEYLDLFDKYSKQFDPVLVASMFTSTLKDLSRRGVPINNLEDVDFFDVLSFVKDKKISKEAIPEILEKVAKTDMNVNKLVEKLNIKPMTTKDLDKVIDKIIRKNKKLFDEKNVSALMGEVMSEVRGRVDGKIVSKILRKKLS